MLHGANLIDAGGFSIEIATQVYDIGEALKN